MPCSRARSFVLLVAAQVEQRPVHFWMQRLDPAIEHFGNPVKLEMPRTLIPACRRETRCAARGNDFDALFLELARANRPRPVLSETEMRARWIFMKIFAAPKMQAIRIHDDPEGERQAEGEGEARQVEHARIAGIKRAPDGRDSVGDGIQMHGPENPGMRIRRWKKRAGHEPERNREHVHDGVKSLGRLHRPGDEKTETGEAKPTTKERAKTNQEPLGCDVDADERREQEKDEPLQKRERGPAKNFSANNAAGRDRRDEDGLEKSFPPIFDDRDESRRWR